MKLLTDDASLELRLELDTEHPDVDLTENGLGDQVLDAAQAGVLDAIANQRDPATGRGWDALAPRTVREKGHSLIGYRTGALLNPDSIELGPRQVEPRWAAWQFHDSSGKAQGFHNGRPGVQPARPIVGWSPSAEETARALVEAADFEARS